MNFITEIGITAPIILLIITLFMLLDKIKTTIIFICGSIINIFINIILKLLIKQTRPSSNKINDILILYGYKIDFNQYGMPSGHAQICAFCLSFVAFYFNNIFLNYIYAIFTIISLIQRYISNRHTIMQLFIGFIVGLLLGYLTFIVINHL